jgi:hypothetical protein
MGSLDDEAVLGTLWWQAAYDGSVVCADQRGSRKRGQARVRRLQLLLVVSPDGPGEKLLALGNDAHGLQGT